MLKATGGKEAHAFLIWNQVGLEAWYGAAPHASSRLAHGAEVPFGASSAPKCSPPCVTGR